MENKYYDTWEFLKTNDITKTNPIEANSRFEEYLQKYPQDYSAYTYYAYNLITLGQFTKAEKILNKLENKFKSDTHFAKQTYKISGLNHDILVNRVRLLCYQEKYDEAYNLLKNNREEFEHMGVSDIVFYCKKKMGKIDFNRRENNSYLFRQIVEYKEEDFMEHIKKHLADYNSNLDEPNKNVFVPNFPINEVVEEIKKYIPSNKMLCTGFWEDVYIFKYNECGRANNRLVNYIKVVCFHNTKDFITILPVSDCENLPCVDLNYLIKEDKQPETRRMSKVDKFNQRYKRK